MKIVEVKTKKDLRDFYLISDKIYENYPCHRLTEDSVMHLLIQGPSTFHSYAYVNAYLIVDSNGTSGRFALIHDQRLPDYVQVSYFEALPHLPNIVEMIIDIAKARYPQCKKIVIGLNGHLNYGAGILINRFNEPPVFGLPYHPEYYQDYFKKLKKKTMISYRFPVLPFSAYYRKMAGNINLRGITVRNMNKKKLRREVEIYTYLNNACFPGHPFWADRDVQEDFELFYPFRFLIKEEHLLFAEKNGEPIGFFLWFPDFNQLVKGNQQFGIQHVIRYRLADPINTFRFAEIAVLPKYRISPAVQAMILHATPYIERTGYTWGEGGFIFEENRHSIAMTLRFLERATGKKMTPYRRYAVFETGS